MSYNAPWANRMGPLTGATGLLGNEILPALLQSGQRESILVLYAGPARPADQFDAPWSTTRSVASSFAASSRSGPTSNKTDSPAAASLSTSGGAYHTYHPLRFRRRLRVPGDDAARAANVGGTVQLVRPGDAGEAAESVRARQHRPRRGRRTGYVAEAELEHDCGFVNFYENQYGAERFLV